MARGIKRLAQDAMDYETRRDRVIREAECILPTVRCRVLAWKNQEYQHHCVICGRGFVCDMPDVTTCSDPCRKRYEMQMREYANHILDTGFEEALEVMKESKQEQVYFVQARHTGRIKIGISRNPTRRLSSLQNGSPEELSLLLAVDGDAGLEKRLHKRFSHCRVIGEWFEPTDDLLALIDELKNAKTDEGVASGEQQR